MKIFLTANELEDTEVLQVDLEENDKKYPILEIVCHNDISAQSLTVLGLRNYGILNMFDDYLIRCGVDPWAIKPYNLIRDREDCEANKKFENFYQKIKKV